MSDTQSPRRRTFVERVVIPIALVCAMAAAVARFDRHTSAVWDESIYLTAALALFHHGSFDRLAAGAIAPLPVMLTYWLPAIVLPQDRIAPEDFARAVMLARVAQLVIVGVPLVLLPYFWMLRRRGVWLATIATGMLALSPALIAFSAVATTDACFVLFALIALAAIERVTSEPTRARLAVAGLAIGLALAAEYSAIVLLPVAFVATALGRTLRVTQAPGRRGRALLAAAGDTIVLGAVALVIVWTFSGFGVSRVFDADWVAPSSANNAIGRALVALGRAVPFPEPVRGIAGQLLHMRGGQPAFLLGARGWRGWWYYFPAALALKSSPMELLVALSLPALLWMRRHQLDPARRVLLLALVIFSAGLPTSRLDIGIRYVLLLYPLVILLAVDCLAGLGAPVAIAGVGLVAMQAVTAIAAAPDYLSYFNRLLTPAGQAYTRLADSNLDWGQELPALRQALSARGTDAVLLAYFGSAPPAAYGIRAIPWDSPDDSAVARSRWIAVSATMLNSVYLRADPFGALRAVRPDDRPSEGMFLFDLSRGDVRAAVDTARARRNEQPCKPLDAAAPADDPMYGVIDHWNIRCNVR